MSEAQAAIALMSLEDFPSNQRNNELLFNLYREHLKSIAGVKLIEPAGVTFSNYQYLICEIDETEFGLSRDQLISVLKAEGVNARRYFYPGTHRSIEFKNQNTSSDFDLPVTDYLCSACLQLPIGALVDRDTVEAICNIVERAHTHSVLLREHLSQRAP
jgi:dTDP-4-amino-4,6-dideoxygalactose transaminase